MNRLHQYAAPLLVLLLLAAPSYAQQNFKLANDWLVPSQEYDKLLVAEDGIYRVQAAQTRFSGQQAANLRLYYKGKEQTIYVADLNANGTFEGNDYIEFYGERLDGETDTPLYKDPNTHLSDPSQQANVHYNLFTDTSAYFLTASATPRPSSKTYQNVRWDQFAGSVNQLSALPSVSNVQQTAIKNYTNARSNGDGTYHHDETLDPNYSNGEGFLSGRFQRIKTRQVPTPFPTGNGSVTITSRLKGASTGSNNQHTVEVRTGNCTSAASWKNLQLREIVNNCNASVLGNNGVTSLEVDPVSGSSVRLAWIRIEYEREPRYNEEGLGNFRWQNNFGQDAHLNLRDFENAGGEAIAYDRTNGLRLVGTVQGDNAHFVVPKGGGARSFVVASGNKISAQSQQVKVRASRYRDWAGNSGGPDFLLITHRSLKKSAEDYATYRDTASVNPHDAEIIYTDEIYDEFGYGHYTPLAIKRFLKATVDNWSPRPRYVLFWGKGVFNPRGEKWGYKTVPTWGAPASDMQFVIDFKANEYNVDPIMSIGRYNVRNNKDGKIILKKVNEYEHTPYQPWMKHALHLGGGANVSQQSSIQNFMQGQHEPIFEGYPYGGRVTYSQKTSNSTISSGTGESTRDRVSNGISILEFFGHSTASVYDVDMLDPFQYNNWGKYPFIVANGCYVGNYAETMTFGEQFILEEGRGAIGYLAESDNGFIHTLGNYTRHFYDVIFDDSLGIPLGDAQRETVKRYLGINADDLPRVQALCNNFQVDPALRIYTPEKPDLTVNSGSVTLAPTDFPADADSFQINLVVENIGLGFDQNFSVEVKHNIIQQNKSVTYPLVTSSPILRADTLSFWVNPPRVSMAGLNTLEITVDVNDTINEMDEDNNSVLHEFFVPSNLPVALFPKQFAITNKAQEKLVAATFTNTAEDVQYIFEIDTTHDFSSPLKRSSGVVNGSSNYAEWDIPFTLQDSAVYYWRVRLENVENTRWVSSSFKYIDGNVTGWAQSKPPQFYNTAKQGITINRDLDQWQFDRRRKSINVELDDRGFERLSFNIQGTEGGQSEPIQGAKHVYFSHIDGQELKTLTEDERFGGLRKLSSAGQLRDLNDVVNGMNKGDYLLVINARDRDGAGNTVGGFIPISQWPQSVWNSLQEVGMSAKIPQLADTTAFIMLGKKGASPGAAQEIVNNNQFGKLVLNTSIASNLTEGSITSENFGPTPQWDQLIWNWERRDGAPADDMSMRVIGVRNDNKEKELFSGVKKGSLDLSGVDASEYSSLRLEAASSDPEFGTPPNLKHWHLHAKPVPELIVDRSAHYEFQSDSVLEGAPMSITATIRNISEFDFKDSVLVVLQVRGDDNQLTTLASRRWRPLPAGEQDTITFNFESTGLIGENRLQLVANPNRDQPEEYLFNNVLFQDFKTSDDHIDPFLDVTFDGQHINDGDVVSPKPEILIQADDENPYFKIDDPSLVEVYFKKEDDPTPISQIQPTSDLLEFVPAKDAENKAKMYFYPGKKNSLEDGTYVLEAQSFDKKRNSSGSKKFRISFEVVNKSTVTDVVNYPNPFSTKTHFVYTLTGLQMPEVFQIQIFTISGRLVKTIDLLEMGEVRAGTHMTDYAWDGRDKYGDKLANGVYLYRVNIRMPKGVDLEKRDEQTAQYFDKGWGKMVLIR